MVAIALFNIAHLDGCQRISTLNSCFNNKHESKLSDNSSSNDYIKNIKYESFAAVTGRMHRSKSNQNNTTTLVPNSAHALIQKSVIEHLHQMVEN